MISAVVAIAALVGFSVWWAGSGVVARQESSTRRLTRLQTRTERLEQSFAERAVAPVVERLGSFVVRFSPTGWSKRTRKRLILAGWSTRMDVNSWAAIRLLSIVGGIGLFFLFQAGVRLSATELAVTAILFAIIGVFGPEAVLSRRIDERRSAIERDLPDMIDLLVISVEAGLGFDSALGRVVQAVPGVLSDEFARVLQETRVGVSRSEAMRALAERTEVDDLGSFILAMNQADTFGVSISRMLRVQADEMRVRRRQRAQEKAFAAPVKMVFPLVLCIFPALFVVLLGPAVVEIWNNFLN